MLVSVAGGTQHLTVKETDIASVATMMQLEAVLASTCLAAVLAPQEGLRANSQAELPP